MIRVYVVVEGQTEKIVVKDLLEPHFAPMNIYLLPIIVHTSPGHRGGGRRWDKWENDIRTILKSQKGPDVRVTTMFDLYGLPSGFPGLTEHGGEKDTNRRCDALQRKMEDVFEDRRFIPYLQRHELEALVLTSLDSLSDLLDDPVDLKGLETLRQEIAGSDPEDIDDGPDTVPSKRLKRRIRSYRKTIHGPMAIEDTGLQVIRTRCPRFGKWISDIESLAQKAD